MIPEIANRASTSCSLARSQTLAAGSQPSVWGGGMNNEATINYAKYNSKRYAPRVCHAE